MKNNTQPALKERIEKALDDFTKGRASMHVPPLDTDVDMVLAECSDRLSELEARCAALAAERDIVNADNVYLRDQIMCWARECDRITYTHTNKVTDAHQREAERDLANTFPANSAFLAEVRAQGVEMAAKSDQFSTWVQQGLRSFAIGVRQGVQS